MNSAKILYGVYSSIKDAKRAMKSLGTQVLASRPYIDNISKHQALYAKYN
jgi:adhesin transport system outer membrane protein